MSRINKCTNTITVNIPCLRSPKFGLNMSFYLSILFFFCNFHYCKAMFYLRGLYFENLPEMKKFAATNFCDKALFILVLL